MDLHQPDTTPPAYPPGLEPTPTSSCTVGSTDELLADPLSEPCSSDESSASSYPESKSLVRGDLRLATLPRSGKRFVAPLDVRFSQMKMGYMFGDGRRVADTVQQIKVTKVSSEEAIEIGAQWKLQVPFPTIEVIRWRAKLRDEDTGRPKVDASGEDVLDGRAHWFTLDNRRLYCLQEAALTVWPDRVVVEVAEVKTGPQTNMMELRKFRTLDRGTSIKIGSVSDNVPFVRWSWTSKVGIDDLDSDASGPESEAHHKKFAKDLGSKFWNSDVLDHLNSLKQDDQDDQERVDISKKLSWILRRGASTIGVNMDGKGWVKAKDLLKAEILADIELDALLVVIERSNKQKRRYEVSTVNGEQLIRATTKRGVDQTNTRTPKPNESKVQTSVSRKVGIRTVPISELQKEKIEGVDKNEQFTAKSTGKNPLPKIGRNHAAKQPTTMLPPHPGVFQHMHAMRHMQHMMSPMQPMYLQHQMAMQHQLMAMHHQTAMRRMRAMQKTQEHREQWQHGQEWNDDSDTSKDKNLESKIADVLEAARKRNTKLNAHAPDFVPSSKPFQQVSECIHDEEEQ